jgi:hypothetical protein
MVRRWLRAGFRLVMAGREQVHIRPGRDVTGHWMLQCELLCNDLGWEIDEVWPVYEWIASMHEFESALPREAAEQRAYADVASIFDLRGRQPN